MMDLVKGQVSGVLDGIKGIPADKKSTTIQTTVSTLMDGFKNHAAQGGLASMLGIGGAASGAASGLESNVVSSLTSKVGLGPDVAHNIASKVVPSVTSLFKNKINDGSDPGFNLQSMVSGLTGKASNAASEVSDGVKHVFEGIFGKK